MGRHSGSQLPHGGAGLEKPAPVDFPRSPLRAWEAAVTHGRLREGSLPPGRGDAGVESNGRLTAMLGAMVVLLLGVEGLTILRITPLLTAHVVIGMVLVPVIVLKIGSITWRFVRYYLGSPAYRRKGAPPPLLRLLGPLVVVSTAALFVTGILLLFVPHDRGLRGELLTLHQVTFVLWFAAMVVHVLGHLLDVARLAPRDFLSRTRRQIRGASLRQWAIVSALCLGVISGVALAPTVGPWLSGNGSTGAKPARTVPAPSTGTTGSKRDRAVPGVPAASIVPGVPAASSRTRQEPNVRIAG